MRCFMRCSASASCAPSTRTITASRTRHCPAMWGRRSTDNAWLLLRPALMILDRGSPPQVAADPRSSTASVSARAWQLLGLPGHQVELVALRVGERGLADRRRARWQRRRRELDLVERPGAQGGQPLHLLVVVVGGQDRMDAVLGRPGPWGIVEDHPWAAVGASDV